MHADGILRGIRRLFAAKADAGATDADLLRRFARTHDESAFELLVWRHAGLVLHVCRQTLRDEHAVEDAFQATFLVLFRKAGSVLRGEALPGWLHRVAYRASLRARPSRLKTGLDLAGVPAPASDDLETDTCRVLHEEIAGLPAKYRLPVVCCYLEGKTHEEAAAELGWPKGTVAGRLARAKDVLHSRLARRGVTLAGLGLAAHLSAGAVTAGMTHRITALLVALRSAGASALSPSAVVLAEGVLNAMFWKSVQWVAVVAVLVGGAGLGGLWVGHSGVAQEAKPKEAAKADKSAATADEEKPAEVADLLKEAENRATARRSLWTLAQAMHDYHSAAGHFPAPAICVAGGKPLLSWRVAILPYIKEGDLYKQFKLDEAWDSPHNKKLLAKMPRVFAPAGVQTRVPNATFYQVFVGAGAVFDAYCLRGLGGAKTGPPSVADITDGTSNTILIAEAGTAVPWTKPEDIPFDAKKPPPALGGQFANVFNVAYADGSVYSFPKTLNKADLRASITRSGGEVPSQPDLGQPEWSPARRKLLNGLAAKNAKLREEATILTAILAEAKNDLKNLRWELDQQKMLAADPKAAELKRENAALEKSIKEGRDEARKLMQELRELKEAMKKKPEK